MSDVNEKSTDKFGVFVGAVVVFIALVGVLLFLRPQYDQYMANDQKTDLSATEVTEGDKSLIPSFFSGDGSDDKKPVMRKESASMDKKKEDALDINNVSTELLGTADEEVLKEQLYNRDSEAVVISDAYNIAVNARDVATQVAAVDAIARQNSVEANQNLMQIFDEVGIAVQEEVADHLYAQSLSSEEAAWMTTKMHTPEVSDKVKYVMAQKLIAAGMLENNGNTAFYSELVGQMPEDVQPYFEQHMERMGNSGR